VGVKMKKFIKNPAIISKTIDQEKIMLNTETCDYFGINEIGSDILELVDGENDLTEIINKLLSIYDVERAVLEADVEEYIKALLERNIIIEQ
jgi:hypothetical protein